MKKFLSTSFIFLTNRYYIFLLNIVYAKRNIIIVDIDNTVAHTYPYIKNEKIESVVSVLPFFPNVVNYILNKQQEMKAKIIFFTVRPVSVFFSTQKWLTKIGIGDIGLFNLFFARVPLQKIQVLQKINTKNRHIVFLDDMSYNTENGTTLYHVNEIATLTNIDVDYISHQTLLEIQNGVFSPII